MSCDALHTFSGKEKVLFSESEEFVLAIGLSLPVVDKHGEGMMLREGGKNCFVSGNSDLFSGACKGGILEKWRRKEKEEKCNGRHLPSGDHGSRELLLAC